MNRSQKEQIVEAAIARDVVKACGFITELICKLKQDYEVPPEVLIHSLIASARCGVETGIEGHESGDCSPVGVEYFPRLLERLREAERITLNVLKEGVEMVVDEDES